MLVSEFWEVYNKHYKQFVSPSFCVDQLIERSSTPHHSEFEAEEEAVKYMFGVCKFITGYRPEGI